MLAAVVQLLEKTLIRVGNDEYARQNRSFGLTTLRDGHVEVERRTRDVLRSAARAASSTRSISTTAVSRAIVKACRDLPGYELFQYRRRATASGRRSNRPT